MPLHVFAPLALLARRWLPVCASAALLGTSWAQAPAPAVPAIEVRTPQGQLAPATWRWQAPAAARLRYKVEGKYKGFPFQTTAQLDWLPQGQRYEASQEVQIPVVGSRRQASVGRLGPQGVAPEVFLDRSRKEYSTSFDASAQQVHFSRGAPSAPWVAGMQDRMSVFFQVAGMVAAAPQRYPKGTTITLQTASSNRITPWTFEVGARETLQLPAGRIQALRLNHRSESSQEDGLEAALWLSAQSSYLPVRIQMREDGGRDVLDLQLQSHSQP